MDYVSELLAEYPPTMGARLLAFILTAGSGRPEDEYKCLKKYPQLTMRTHVRALAAIVDHANKSGDTRGAFALGVKLCNLRAAAKWGIEHYQRRIQVGDQCVALRSAARHADERMITGRGNGERLPWSSTTRPGG